MGDFSEVSGTSQAQRFLPQLDPARIQLQGLPREAMLAFAARFSALLRYYNLANQIEGSFADFFASDPEVQLAVIATFPAAPAVERLRGEAERLVQDTRAGKPLAPQERERIGEVVSTLLGTLDAWWRRLAGNELLKVFQLGLRNTLARELSPKLGSLLTAAPELRPSVSGLDAEVWRLSSLTSGDIKPLSPPLDRGAVSDRLLRLADALEAAWKLLAAEARDWLETEEVQQAPRPPHMALFLSFLRMREAPLQLMNELPARQLRSYYEQVLQQAPRGPVPDSVIVSFQPAKQAKKPVLLPAGTLLSAGKDTLGQPRTYQLSRDTRVDLVALAQVMTLWVPGEQGGSAPRSGVVLTSVASGVTPGVNSVTPASPFPAFGAAPPVGPGVVPQPPAPVGLAISSPMLELAGGMRSIILTFTLSGALQSPPPAVAFQVQLSGAQGWIPVPCTTERSGDTLTLTLALDSTQPAVAPYRSKVLGNYFSDGPPVLLAYFDQDSGAVAESDLTHATVTQVSIQVQVQGSRAFSIASSGGPLVAGKPFAPFGYAPPKDARFMVGCPEAFQKPLTSLTLHLSWLNLPAGPQYPYGFASYYSGYELALYPNVPDDTLPPPIYLDRTFQAELEYRLHGTWLSLNAASASPPSSPGVTEFPLFMSTVSPPSPLGSTSDLGVTAPSGQALNTPVPELPATLSWTQMPDSGVLSLRLTAPEYGFGQSLYGPATAALALRTMRALMVELKQDSSLSPPGPSSPLPWLPAHSPSTAPPAASPLEEDPNTMADPSEWARTLPPALSLPYTPMVDDVLLDYSAEEQWGPGPQQGLSLWQVGPLGMVPITLSPSVGSPPSDVATTLLPELAPGGSLFLGFSGLAPGASVSCLFVIEATGAASAYGPQPPSIIWSYYDGQKWRVLDQVDASRSSPLSSSGGVADQTAALGRSGVISFVLPADAGNWTAQQAPGIRWFQGYVPEPEAFPALVAIQPQAVWCTRVLNPAGDQAYAVPLPPATITGLATANANIASVSQPLPSVPGAPAEDTRAFYARVSERCRHKARAVTAWDYERLTLSQFPWVFAARCLPGYASREAGLQGGATGDVLVLVSRRGSDPSALTADAYVPLADRGLLSDVQSFLAERASRSAHIHVASPVYVPVTVRCKLAAAAGQDPSVVAQQLNTDLRALLSPWIFTPSTASSLTHVSSTLQIRRFIETRPYVSKVSQFECQLRQAELSDGALGSLGLPPYEVPVSAWQHVLTVVSGEG